MTAKIRWHLSSLAEGKGILGPSALRAALEKHGYALSVAQASRLLRHPPSKVDIAMLRALCKTFNCGLTDLLDLGLSEAPSQDGKETSKESVERAASPERESPEQSSHLMGPRAIALRPLPARTVLRSVE